MALRRYFGKISPLQIGNLVGHNGELVIDETTDKIYIMDGVTPGGHEIANVSANLNIEYTNVSPALDSAYTLGTSSFKWNNLWVNESNFLGNLHIDTNINPDTTPYTSNLKIIAARVNAYHLYADGDLISNNSITGNTINAASFVEISPNDNSGYIFSNPYYNTTGMVHANVGSSTAIIILSNANPSLTTYSNGYNTIAGYTQFFQNVYITGNSLTIPNNTTIGLLPTFTPTNAKITYVDDVNNYTQFLLQNKNSGSNASGDVVVTADDGTDSTHYIDMGINSSTFTGGGGLDAANDGYLLVEGGKLVIMTIDQPNDIVFAIGGDSPSNEIGRWKASNGLVVTGNITASGNVNIAGNLTVTGNILTTNYETISLTEYANNITASGNITASANVNAAFFVGNAYYVTGLTVYGNAQVATYLPTDSTIISLFSNAATQASNLASLASNAATQENEISLLNANVTAANANASTQATLINTINANIISANSAIATLQTQVYSNSNVSAYYVANTVATGNIQILTSGNIRLPTGGTINESAGSGTITLTPNTSASALAGVAIGGSGYLLAANNTRNAVLNYGSINGQFGIYQVNVYGNQQNAIINGGAANNYGNIGGISSFFGNLFVSNVYSPNYNYPNGVSILSGISGNYGNTQVAAYLPTYTGTISASYLTSPGGTDLTILPSTATGTRSYGHFVPQFSNTYNLGSSSLYWQNAWVGNLTIGTGINYANGVAFSGGSSYGNTQVAAYLPTYNGNIGNITTGNLIPTANTAYYLGNSTLYWANAYANNFNAATQLATPKIQFTVGGASILEDNSLDLAIIGKYQISIKGNGVQQYTFGNDGSFTGPGGVIAWANGAIGGNVIATGVYWSNGVAFSSGSSTYGNTQVGYYLNSNLISSTISLTGNVIANAHYGNSYLYSNGVSILSGISGTYGNTQVAAYLPTYTGNISAGNVNVSNLNATGNVTASNFVTTGSYGNISGANVITANTFIGTSATISGNLYSPSQTGKSAAIVAQNTSVTMDNIKVQWLNNGSTNANQLQIGSVSGTPSILYTYVFEAGTGGTPSGGSSSTSLSTTYANIGNPSGTAGDLYMVTATVGTNAYRVSAITGSGYSNNLISIERLV